MANLITLVRILLVFVVVTLIYTKNPIAIISAFLIIIMVILLDGLDGYIARSNNIATSSGAVMDILGDRIVESTLWIVFAHVGIIPVWIPILIIVRGFVTDAFRSIALRYDKTPFGKNTMIKSEVGRLIVSSRASRALYATVKVVSFCYLILYLALIRAGETYPGMEWLSQWNPIIYKSGMVFVYLTVLLCVLRGIPVILDGIGYL